MSRGKDIGIEIDLQVGQLREVADILFVCLSHSWGGLERVAATDAIELAALGLKVRFLSLEGTPVHGYLAKKKELNVIPLSFRPRNYFDFKLRSELLRLVNDGVNIIHTHQTSLLGSITPWFWRKPEVAIIATRHIMNNHNKKNYFHRAIYSRLDYLVVVSQAIKRNILETHPLNEKVVKVVNLGLDFKHFDSARVKPELQRAKWGVDPETTVIGLVGRIDPDKGQEVFIKAAAGLLKVDPNRKLKFVLVGEETLGAESGYLEYLKVLVRQFRIEDHFVFAGFSNDVPEVMQAFDILVMPSRQEAFGLVAIEAMAMETAIVISQGGSADEIVGDQRYGLTVRPEDPFDLQRQLSNLLERPEERKEIGIRARIHVMEHYERRVRLLKML